MKQVLSTCFTDKEIYGYEHISPIFYCTVRYFVMLKCICSEYQTLTKHIKNSDYNYNTISQKHLEFQGWKEWEKREIENNVQTQNEKHCFFSLGLVTLWLTSVHKNVQADINSSFLYSQCLFGFEIFFGVCYCLFVQQHSVSYTAAITIHGFIS